jgi:hypothetical protein
VDSFALASHWATLEVHHGKRKDKDQDDNGDDDRNDKNAKERDEKDKAD